MGGGFAVDCSFDHNESNYDPVTHFVSFAGANGDEADMHR